MKFQRDLLAVQITGEVQDPWFYGNMVAIYGGTGANIGDGGKLFAVKTGKTGIDTEFWDQNILRQMQIGCGNADGPAQLPAWNYSSGENVGMTEETVGTFHLSLLQKGADVGRGDPDAVHGLLRNHNAGKLPLGAIGAQLFGIAFAAVAEPEIVAADEACGNVILQIFQKILPIG